LPALLANLARVFLRGLQPFGMVTWAYLSEAAERRFSREGALPKPLEWTSGKPCRGGQTVLTELKPSVRGIDTYQKASNLRPCSGSGILCSGNENSLFSSASIRRVEAGFRRLAWTLCAYSRPIDNNFPVIFPVSRELSWRPVRTRLAPLPTARGGSRARSNGPCGASFAAVWAVARSAV
jgi:RTX toxin acyltransferase family.